MLKLKNKAHLDTHTKEMKKKEKREKNCKRTMDQ